MALLWGEFLCHPGVGHWWVYFSFPGQCYFCDEMASDNNDEVKAQLLLLKQDNQAMQTSLKKFWSP